MCVGFYLFLFYFCVVFFCVCLVLLIVLPLLRLGKKKPDSTLAGLMILCYGQCQKMALCYMVAPAFLLRNHGIWSASEKSCSAQNSLKFRKLFVDI